MASRIDLCRLRLQRIRKLANGDESLGVNAHEDDYFCEINRLVHEALEFLESPNGVVLLPKA